MCDSRRATFLLLSLAACSSPSDVAVANLNTAIDNNNDVYPTNPNGATTAAATEPTKVNSGVWENVALNVTYCLPGTSMRTVNRSSVSPDSPGAFACGLGLTFSNVPLCKKYAPKAPFQKVLVFVEPKLGTYSISSSADNKSTVPAVAAAEVSEESFGDPTPCLTTTATYPRVYCAFAPDIVSATAGTFTLTKFVDGGASGPSHAEGFFSGVQLPAVPAGMRLNSPEVAMVPAVGPSDGTFNVDSCIVDLQPE